MSERLTKQGVRDLNPKGYDGRRRKHDDPIECQHNWQEDVEVGTETHEMGLSLEEWPVYGKRCLWCGETRRG